MKVRIGIIGSILILLSFSCRDEEIVNKDQHLSGQENGIDIGCRTSEMNKAMANMAPAGYQGRGTLLTGSPEARARMTRATQQKYIIPVVFHVFGTDFLGKSVTVELIEDALKRTNEDFQGLTADWQQITPPFDLIKETLNIEFRLAQKDPQGNPTSGVTFHPVTSGFGGLDKNAEIASFAWDNYKYMNVYVMVDLYGNQVLNNSGVAWYPDEWMSDLNIARVVYNGAYIGKNTDENFRSVMTHEFGHWLGLAHTFEGGCTYPNDEVEDTPPHEDTFMGEFDLNCEGNKTNWQNFMNYTDMYANFTAGQVERMLTMLNHPARFPIWQEENLKKTLYLGDEAVVETVKPTLFEDKKNDGTFSGHFELKVMFGTLKAAVNTELPAENVQVKNLPEGLSVRVRVESPTSLYVFVDGKAKNHTSADNKAFQLHLTGDICDKPLYEEDLHLELRFRNPYQIVVTNVNNSVVSAANNQLVFQVSSVYPSSVYGLSYDKSSGKLQIDAKGKALVSETFSRNVSLLTAGTEISKSLSWIQGSSNFLHDLYMSSYTKWAGKTGYVGFYFQGADDTERLYGWMNVSVTTGGDSVILHSYAFSEEPGVAIRAGQRTMEQTLIDPEIQVDNYKIKAGEQVHFTFSGWSSGEITAYHWSFPGGTPATSSESQPEIVYGQSGTFGVSVEITENSGQTTTVTRENLIRVIEEVTNDRPEVIAVLIAKGHTDCFFRIKDADHFPDSELTIWNPRREEILKCRNYRNDYNMKEQPAGTYYYHFSWKSGNKTEEITGNVELIR